MTSRAARAGAACLLIVGAIGAPRAAAAEVSMSATHVATRIGEDFRFTSTIANPSSAPLSGLIAHVDVVSRDPDVYVDPEDWSSERTRYLPPIAAGSAIEIPWKVKAVNAGRFDVYVVVLGAGRPDAGPALDVRVAQRTTIDSGGVLPLAIGVPALLAVALLGVRRRRPR
jgi:thiamine pyrophosphate-dependent acetolactate synthase large subunit-like protein